MVIGRSSASTCSPPRTKPAGQRCGAAWWPRGLSGVALVVSDAHEGLEHAIAAVLPGATSQRCRTHATGHLHTCVPKSAQAMVATLVATIFAQSDAAHIRDRFDRVVDQLERQFPAAAELLIDAEVDLLAFSSFPVEHWRQIWSNNGQERRNKELRRRTDVAGIFPNRPALIRHLGAVLAEQHDQWAVARRSMSAESLAKARLRIVTADEVGTDPKEVEPAELQAVSRTEAPRLTRKAVTHHSAGLDPPDRPEARAAVVADRSGRGTATVGGRALRQGSS
jgi:hypothetical protein